MKARHAPSHPPSSPVVTLRHRLEAALFDAIEWAIHLFPGSAPRLGALLGRLACRLDRRHRRAALDNVRLAYPEIDPSEALALVRRCFRNFGVTLVDTIASTALDRASYRERFEIEGWEHLRAAEGRERGVLMMTGHLGNWEAIAQLMALEDRPLWVVARPMDNPLVERRVRHLRERWGNRTIPKRGGVRQMLRALKARERVGLLIDQRVHPHEGEAFDFFGHPAYTTPLLATLSLRTGAPVVPFFGLPGEGGRIRVRFEPPVLPTGAGDEAVRLLTRRYLAVLEREIRRNPELWLWMHRRWRKNPTDRPSRRSRRAAGGSVAAG